MRYVKVTWHHDFPDEPVHYFHEVGDDNYETRRVQIYRDGHAEWADETHETATAGVAEIPIGPLEEITSQPEFDAEDISQEQFEQQWARARETPRR